MAASVQQSGTPLFYDSLRAIDDYQKDPPLPALHLDFESM